MREEQRAVSARTVSSITLLSVRCKIGNCKAGKSSKCYLYAALSDGEKAELYTCEWVADPETYVVEEQIHSAVFEVDMWMMTLTENPGTEQEKVYTRTVSKGNSFMVDERHLAIVEADVSGKGIPLWWVLAFLGICTKVCRSMCASKDD